MIQKTTAERIRKQADISTGKEIDRLRSIGIEYGNMVFQASGYHTGYIAGATAENERAQKLVDALENWMKAKSKLTEAVNAGHGHYVAEAQEVVYKAEDSLNNALQQWSGKEVGDE